MRPTSTQRRIVAALTARGYERPANQKSTRYVELTPGPECRSLLRPAEDGSTRPHRVLVGRAGALRYTSTTIAASVSFSDAMKRRLISEHAGGPG